MIICLCKKITSNQVMEAIDCGATEVEQLTERLGLGSNCGCCVEYARAMVMQQTQTIRVNQAVSW